MQLTCSHCATNFTTMEILTEKALGDISNQFVKHFNERHPGESRQMAKELIELQAIVVWVVMMAKHTTLLDKEPSEGINDPIMDKFSEMVERVEDILGVEVFDNKPEMDDVAVNEVKKLELAASPVEPLIKLY